MSMPSGVWAKLPQTRFPKHGSICDVARTCSARHDICVTRAWRLCHVGEGMVVVMRYRLIGLGLVAGVVLSMLASASVGWSAPQTLSDAGRDAYGSEVAVSAEGLTQVIVWNAASYGEGVTGRS